MSAPQSRQNPGTLSVGNVVSAGLRIYRDRFRAYFNLAIIGSLWSIVPVYGWAKFAAISGTLSHLAFNEALGRPEPMSEVRRRVDPRMWQFLLAGILIGLINFIPFVIFIPIAIVAAVVLPFFLGESPNPIAALLLVLLAIAAFIVLILAFIWLAARLAVVTPALAVENNLDATQAISKSWKLTKSYVLRIQLIFFVAFLVILPLSIALSIGLNLFQFLLFAIVGENGGSLAFPIAMLNFLIDVSLRLVFNALALPFWQGIVGIIYYDLRSRKEGIDLQFRQL